jgi:transposase
LSAFLVYLWLFTRIFIKVPSGRQRFNVLGAINAISKELVLVTNTGYITSIQICEMLVKIAARRTQGVPITIVLDNARYQRCRLVMEKAAELGIELLFLPLYSPNLSLIERLWKFVKKEVLYSIYYDNFEKFTKAIMECLSQTETKHKKALDSLLTWKFQTFSQTSF